MLEKTKSSQYVVLMYIFHLSKLALHSYRTVELFQYKFWYFELTQKINFLELTFTLKALVRRVLTEFNSAYWDFYITSTFAFPVIFC